VIVRDVPRGVDPASARWRRRSMLALVSTTTARAIADGDCAA
jgi:hypothetical protein